MQLSTVNRDELTEVVYFPEMADKPPTLTQRMERVETALGLWHKKTAGEWTRDHWLALSISVGTFILVAIGYFAWWQPQWKQHADDDLANQIDRQIDKKLVGPLATLSEQGKSLSRIEGKLDSISDLLRIVAQNEMKRDAALPLNEFQKNLGDIGTVLTVARAERIVSPHSAQSIRAKLLQSDQGQPNYWSAAAAMVNYQTTGDLPKLPPCDLKNQPPAKLAKDLSATATTIEVALVPFENCEVVLDSAEAQERFLSVLGLFDIEFRRCRVIYKGGGDILPPPYSAGQEHAVPSFQGLCF